MLGLTKSMPAIQNYLREKVSRLCPGEKPIYENFFALGHTKIFMREALVSFAIFAFRVLFRRLTFLDARTRIPTDRHYGAIYR